MILDILIAFFKHFQRFDENACDRWILHTQIKCVTTKLSGLPPNTPILLHSVIIVLLRLFQVVIHLYILVVTNKFPLG